MEENNSLAPIVVFAYNRAFHLRRMLESLEKCYLSDESEVFIFADGPKNKPGDLEKVQEVREYLEKIVPNMKFKHIHIFLKDANLGLAKSVISGVSQIINQYGKAIVLEDDLIYTRDFLIYMNNALAYYEKNRSVWSISGYTPKLRSLTENTNEVYRSKRGSSWGWASWADRWNTVDWDVKEYGSAQYWLVFAHKFMRGGNDLPGMLRHQMQGRIDSWAVRWCYAQSRQDKDTIYPVRSRVLYLGNDGSGTHCGNSGVADEKLDDAYNSNPVFDKCDKSARLKREFYHYYSSPFVKTLIIFVKYRCGRWLGKKK